MSTVDRRKNHLPPTLKLKNMKMLVYVLNGIGAFPWEAFRERRPFLLFITYFMPFETLFVVYMLTNFVYHNVRVTDLATRSQCAITLILQCCQLIRTTRRLLPAYGYVFKTFFEKNHLYYLKDVSPFHNDIYNKVEKMTNFYTYVEIFFIIMLPGSMVAINVFVNYQNGLFSPNPPANVTWSRISYWKLPFIDTEPNIYIYLTIEYLGSQICALSTLQLDLVIAVLVFHLIGHIVVMVHEVETLEVPVDEAAEAQQLVYNDEQNKILSDKIVRVVHHHVDVIAFCDMISDFSGVPVMCNYFYQLVCGCLLLILTTSMDFKSAAQFTVITASTFTELVVISFIFEMVVITSKNLPHALYSSAWEKASCRNRRSVFLMLLRMQQPLQVKGLDIVTFGFDTMIAILKTTFSYFIFLRSFT
uniref:Odorant receptor n=1 Tax=Conopomorpha sinensis TaxID=940481 RepID=A0AAU8BDH4_9NEOP